MSRYDDIISYLQVLLGGISVANGYNTDAGANVYLNLEYEEQPATVPCIIIYPDDVMDSLEGDPAPGAGEENHYLPIRCEGWVNELVDGSQGQALRQDILKRVKGDWFLGGLTEGFQGNVSSAAEIEAAGETGLLGFVQVEFTVFYVTAWGVE